MLAAIHAGIPTILHEPNAVLGRTNHLLSSRVTHIATSFPELKGLAFKDQSRLIVVGTPVRAAIKAIRDVPYPQLEPEGVLRILVMGGSQGARVFSEVLPEALALLPPFLRTRIRIDQQCRPEDVDQVRKQYQTLQVSADIATFFSDVPARLAAAHLVISRAGASTLAELTVAGRPSLLVPFPQATDNHQHYNASHIESAQGGWVTPQHLFTPHHLASRLEHFLLHSESLSTAASHAKMLGIADSVERLITLVESC
jgi:UDP-N-acetylglucosamine--N-acetylmuramyl-(pentapeptide) pyrophosphoryl-undecaprenol N-acetylglucosamine transferase